MDVQISQLPPIPVVMVRHQGSYDELSAVFDKLWEWVSQEAIPVKRTIGIYWDNPDFTPEAQLRSAACYEVPIGYQLGGRGGLPVELTEIAGGVYAITRFVGPYDRLANVWTRFTNTLERDMHRQISEANPAFEVYINDASETLPDGLITDLYMPLA